MKRNCIRRNRPSHALRIPISALVIALAVLMEPASAQKIFTSPSGDTSPDMSGVADVLHGKVTLLPEDDAALAVVNNEQLYTTQLIPLNSQNSAFQQQSTVATNLNALHSSAYAASSVISSSASGRMFNNGNDVVITLGQNSQSSNVYSWAYSYWNPVTGSQQGPYTLNQELEPNGNPIYTKVVMGDFQGNNLQSALMFAESDFTNGAYNLWQMNIVAAADPSQIDDINTTGGGPVISAEVSPSQTPVSTTLVAGDFNQDGIDEIAVMLADGQTVKLYKVDPTTLAITLWQTFELPAPLTNATLAAGRFNSSPNVVLAAIGQQQGTQQITVDYIDPITNVKNPSVTIVPTTFAVPNLDSSTLARIYAQAAPVINWSQSSVQQLVLGLEYWYHSWHAVLIGTFGPGPNPSSPTTNFNFNLQEATGYNGCLFGMQVGNFDSPEFSNLQNTTNPALQIALFKSFHNNSQCAPPYSNGNLHVELRGVDVPGSVISNPQAAVNPPTDWLDNPNLYTDLVPNLPSYDAVTSISFFIGDFQGRSERLGAPEHITLTGHIQPNFVLGMPPMHVDWIQPFGGTGDSCEPNTQVPGRPECILNLDVKPNAVNTNSSPAFSSTYAVSATDAVQTTRKSTSSWALTAKITEGISAKYSIPLESSGSASFKESVSNNYNNIHEQYDSTYSTKAESLTTQTGFDDAIFFTSETENFYNYPVLGQTDGNGNPLYVTFSVPSQVQITHAGGSAFDWYQPIHEPGNLLSYPGSETILQNEYSPGSISVQADSGNWLVGNISGTNTVSWNTKQQGKVEAGWTDAFSQNVDLSVSGSAGGTIFGAGAEVNFSQQIDVGHSNTWGTLNTNVNTSESSQAVLVTVPKFGNTTNFNYPFESYVFGTTNAVPTWQSGTSLLPALPNQETYGVLTTGPLFAGFTADVGSASFWQDAYNQPDVGFNHPNRWAVSVSNQASFNAPITPSANWPLISQSFYRMKGLFITTGAAPSGGGALGASTVQSVPAGQSIAITARVYNFSLVSTNQANPGSTVHVRIYGQRRCQVNYSDGQAIDLCPNGAFQIPGSGRDGDVIIASIPGFSGSGPANWALASVQFDTTGLDNTELVFWAVTWIEDANGNVIPETPGHGVTLQSFAGQQFKNITDIPLEGHSNNVGFYSANHPFYIAPALNPGNPGSGTPEPERPLQSIALNFGPSSPGQPGAAPPVLPVDQATHFIARFTATAEAAFPGSTIVYYDGNPAKGGTLLDLETVHSLLPGSSTEHLVPFQPEQCGPHTIYAITEREGFPASVATISTTVTINSAAKVAGMITDVRSLKLQPLLERALLLTLDIAQTRFREGHVKSGVAALKVFDDLIQLIPARKKNELQNQIDILLGDAQLVQTCEAKLEALSAVTAARN